MMKIIPYDQRFELTTKDLNLPLKLKSDERAQKSLKGWFVALVAAIAFSHCSRPTKATYRAGVS